MYFTYSLQDVGEHNEDCGPYYGPQGNVTWHVGGCHRVPSDSYATCPSPEKCLSRYWTLHYF